ncbi:MBL fold metallo-hydrolase [Kineobactrum salinum]|uniref:MBL fold metallo-hydrolase n=1 Tax=Kineobactrum salinum TaxID=2708301 RepID=A0A6C0U034_9GAMM|nr:MBL fold metallo-hydrolase [Kineobactrum salinum]QIB64949.1 MBL fold metallo-hydrolase [Kineobactrum salinum]
MLSWQIGDVKVTRLLELENASFGPESGLPMATPSAVKGIEWLAPYFIDTDGQLLMSFHGFLLETPDYKIIVDTCLGADKERGIPQLDHLDSPYLSRLTEAGMDRTSIDYVICTHLHLDHVGWNTMKSGNQWVPTFPNARYLIGAREMRRWEEQETDEIHRLVFLDSVKPVLDAGLVDTVDDNHKLCPEVYFTPTLGHTEGHISVMIESGGKKAIITGDFVHHPCQFAHPEWSHDFDDDPDLSTQTRREQFANMADEKVLVLGSHFRTPTSGQVCREGMAFKFETDE